MQQTEIAISTVGSGLYPITEAVVGALGALPKSGLLNCYIVHTSASLLIQENFDSTARDDLEEFFNRIAPENQAWHTHTTEGPDDTTSHLKAALTQTSLNIPIRDGALALGQWQGIYLFEHRKARHQRKIILTVIG
jgi:secondary thiamine-phosphate synthase enzyme